MNKAELKAKLMAEAEAAIDVVLEKAATEKPMKLREIVGIALEGGEHLETAIMATLSQDRAEGAAPVCEQCGRVMQHKGRRRRAIVTEAGETRLERAYYYCARCKVGHFPPG